MPEQTPAYDPVDVSSLMHTAMAAAATIKELRAENERLAAKAQAYDQITILMRFMRTPSLGMGEDIAWKLERQVERIRTAAVAAEAPPLAPAAADDTPAKPEDEPPPDDGWLKDVATKTWRATTDHHPV